MCHLGHLDFATRLNQAIAWKPASTRSGKGGQAGEVPDRGSKGHDVVLPSKVQSLRTLAAVPTAIARLHGLHAASTIPDAAAGCFFWEDLARARATEELLGQLRPIGEAGFRAQKAHHPTQERQSDMERDRPARTASLLQLQELGLGRCGAQAGSKP